MDELRKFTVEALLIDEEGSEGFIMRLAEMPGVQVYGASIEQAASELDRVFGAIAASDGFEYELVATWSGSASWSAGVQPGTLRLPDPMVSAAPAPAEQTSGTGIPEMAA